jgi:lysozyme
MLEGIDIASYQGAPDFAQVAASGVTFVITKATESVTYVNPYFRRNWSAIAAAGLCRGVYHFARFDASTPEAEADFFLAVVGDWAPGDVPVLDIESGWGHQEDNCLRWLSRVEAALGCRPLLYSGVWYMEPHGLTRSPALAEYGLWLAAYQHTPPAAPADWPFWAIWQYSDAGVVPGIVGPCDRDRFNGDDPSRFAAYGVPG